MASSLVVRSLQQPIFQPPVRPLLTVSDFQKAIKGQLLLAPLTRGGNLPFRRLCADFGANFTMSEMAYARRLFKGGYNNIRRERSLSKSVAAEKYFGFQVCKCENFFFINLPF